MCGARRSSLQHLLSTPVKPVIASGQTGSAGENDEEPTNVSPGRPPSIDIETKEKQQVVD